MIACALSGGVDSAVSLHLLLKRYPRRLVKAVFMRNWNEGGDNQCPLSEDLKSAQAVAEHFDVELSTVDLSREYWLNVFEPMLQDYSNGFTPNPDVLCNRHIKFDSLLNFCQRSLGTEKLATGHYARIETLDSNESNRLLRSTDLRKDQTFFLGGISRRAIQFAEFPVGDMLKRRVKEMAVEIGLSEVASRKESMGICFIGKRNFKEFIDQYLHNEPGNFVDIDTGEIVGRHGGKHFYTLGQRAKIHSDRIGLPYFVADTTQDTDILVCRGNAHPSLFADELRTFEPHWLNPTFENWTGYLTFKSQHTDAVSVCKVIENGKDGLSIKLGHFKRAVARGQFIVLYHGDECVGSAKIRHSSASIRPFSVNSGQNRLEGRSDDLT